jgi:hypothetical protein
MIKTIFLAMMCLLLLVTAISAQDQQGFAQPYPYGQYANEPSQSDGYSSAVPAGAPVPVAPNSPLELGLSIPAEDTSYDQAPPSTETSKALIPANAAYAAGGAPSNQFSGEFQKTQDYSGNYPADTYPTQSMVVIPPGTVATNKLYVSYVPQTVAGCRLYGWLPMWLQTSGSGPIWFYEWYPSGKLNVNYLGYASGGWQKKWFNGDTPGWHILQYHSRGWSNYIYIYVYGQNSGGWTDLGPYAGSTSTSATSYQGTSSVTMRSSRLKGYDVYLDGKYIGTDGIGSDILDGVYRFQVPGNMWHTIVITKNGQSYDETGTFLSGASYRFTL